MGQDHPLCSKLQVALLNPCLQWARITPLQQAASGSAQPFLQWARITPFAASCKWLCSTLVYTGSGSPPCSKLQVALLNPCLAHFVKGCVPHPSWRTLYGPRWICLYMVPNGSVYTWSQMDLSIYGPKWVCLYMIPSGSVYIWSQTDASIGPTSICLLRRHAKICVRPHHTL